MNKIKCSKCKRVQDPECFYTDKRVSTGRQSQCKKCFRITQLKYNSNNVDKVKKWSKHWYLNNKEQIRLDNLQKRQNDKYYDRRRDLKYHHNITLEEYAKLAKAQNNKCAICGKSELSKNKYLLIDHDHNCCNPGKSCNKCRRGLLCNHCNRGLGAFYDDMQLFKKAIKYLKDNKVKLEKYERR